MTRNKKPPLKLIAITGGIGSGKSTAANIIKAAGYPVLSCDEITADLYKKAEVKRELKKLFPTAVTGEKRLSANKKEIARLCFNDDGNYKKLCGLLTTKTFGVAMKKAKRLGGTVFMEVPLLFECGLQNEFFAVIVVKRNDDARIAGVIGRSAITKEEVIARMNRQFDYSSADLSKFVVIQNDGTTKELKSKLLSAIKKIL